MMRRINAETGICRHFVVTFVLCSQAKSDSSRFVTAAPI